MLARSHWAPEALSLNFETAQRAVISSPANLGTGVFELRYVGWGEDY
jgi:hypothetical protein